jgi:hypothetical protein
MALIRARSVVRVHPGPPFKSPVNTRLFSFFPSRRISLEREICQLFANFTIGPMALHSGVMTLSHEGRTASIDWAMSRTLPCHVEGRGRQCKTLQGTARLWKEREVIFSQFALGLVQLVRTPACHGGDRGIESTHPRHS